MAGLIDSQIVRIQPYGGVDFNSTVVKDEVTLINPWLTYYNTIDTKVHIDKK